MKQHLWVETYAPDIIEDCILPQTLKDEFNAIVDLPNMLLIGDAGVGKTTVAKVLCDTLRVDTMFMNASNERGIDEVRSKIQQFASTTSLFGGYKALILDEADNLTPDAQKALRALIEQHQKSCRFILTCNYPWKLIDPLRSRMTEYYFTFPPESKELINAFVKRMIEILMKEKVTLEQEDIPVLMSLTKMFYPNWRKCIHELQRCCAGGSLDRRVVTQLQGQHISSLFELMKAKNFTKVREWVAENLAQGVSDTDVVNSIYKEMKDWLQPASLPSAVLVLGEYQHKAVAVANQEINTVAMAVELMMNCEFQ